MTTTTIVPDWDGIDELNSYLGPIGQLDLEPFGPTFSKVHGCRVLHFGDRLEALPPGLWGMSVKATVVKKPNSPVTSAVDGVYIDEAYDITARVETYITDRGRTAQSITVTGQGNKAALQTVNDWFDDLIAGRKTHLNKKPIKYPPQPEPAPMEDPPDRSWASHGPKPPPNRDDDRPRGGQIPRFGNGAPKSPN